ncbi:DUF1772 domain-containing protein [Aspergillus glaucus CBS 516.65]|uniref:DUF1772 domain-containing protein n=1 Tax=Aspergillus glaucus CBS 516.65 TaxID=1160497 RepID=A0A1L9VMV8_ASPGL|nr:hypothetical protein ASPGLDRAFT_46247 [Aspergillus glaucus CBS 516.65]OJJ85249.1 hypothetical protein ASPGLDRAFT_46247 [Aspergillus glaucus CBS 516.65]
MSEYPTALRVAQAVGISGSIWLSGNICGLSAIAMPVFFRSRRERGEKDNIPQTKLARQWESFYDHGHAQNPPIAAATACAYAYLGWAVGSRSELFSRLAGANTGLSYRLAGFLTVGIVPWTLGFMMPTNYKLMEIAQGLEGKEVSDEEFDEVLRHWQVTNAIRGLFPLAGGLLGLLTALL